MKTEPQVFRDDGDYIVHAGGHWRRCATYADAVQCFSDLGCRMAADSALAYATRVHRCPDFSYRPVGRRRWMLDGNPVTVEVLRWALRQAGFWPEEIENWLRIERLLYEVFHAD